MTARDRPEADVRDEGRDEALLEELRTAGLAGDGPPPELVQRVKDAFRLRGPGRRPRAPHSPS